MQGEDRVPETSEMLHFFIVALCVVVQSMAATMVSVLWPLIIKDKFGWTSNPYSYLVRVRATTSVVHRWRHETMTPLVCIHVLL